MVFTPPVASDLQARAFLYSELAKFARAGFGIDKACESIAGQAGSDRTAREICRSILDGFQSGMTLADDLRQSRYPVSGLEVAMIDAAERGGKLELGFRHLAEHFRQEATARRRIRRALIYPVFLLHFAAAVGIGITALMRHVNPAAVDGAGRATVMNGLFWVGAGYAVAIAAAIVWKALNRAAGHSAALDALLRRVPLAGPLRESRGLGRFCETLHLFLVSGQKMDLAWERAGEASQSGQLLRYAGWAAPRLAAGASVGEVAAASRGALPANLSRGLASADLAGSLDRETEQWADYYRVASAENMERFAEWAPKLFYWATLLFAGGMVIRAAFSYFDLFQGLLDLAP